MIPGQTSGLPGQFHPDFTAVEKIGQICVITFKNFENKFSTAHNDIHYGNCQGSSQIFPYKKPQILNKRLNGF